MSALSTQVVLGTQVFMQPGSTGGQVAGGGGGGGGGGIADEDTGAGIGDEDSGAGGGAGGEVGGAAVGVIGWGIHWVQTVDVLVI